MVLVVRLKHQVVVVALVLSVVMLLLMLEVLVVLEFKFRQHLEILPLHLIQVLSGILLEEVVVLSAQVLLEQVE